MAQKQAFRERLELIAAGSSVDVLIYPTSKRVGKEERHHVTLTSYRDVTSAPTSVQIRVDRKTDKYYLAENASVSLNVVYTWDDEVVLTEGEQLEIYFNVAVSGDQLQGWVQGYRVEA